MLGRSISEPPASISQMLGLQASTTIFDEQGEDIESKTWCMLCKYLTN